MHRASFIFIGMLSLPFLLTTVAQAADGKLSAAVQMRSGPGNEFPTVTRLAKNLSVDIHGCLKDWDWCDVSWRGNRGWVRADSVYSQKGDEHLPIQRYGTQLGIPEITFQINSYWDNHYNDALWYGERDRLRQSASFPR
jgi:uncharacterized protein YraI